MLKLKNIYPRHTIFFDSKVLYSTMMFFLKIFSSNKNNKINEFEQAFSNYIGAKETIAVSSGRLALYLILKAFEFPIESEIIVSAYNFPPVISVIIHSGLSPVFVDITTDTFDIDENKIEEKINSKTKAILVTHMFGNPCNMDRVQSIANRYGLKIIEDCAHAFGSEWRIKKSGNLGDAAFFSLSNGKNIAAFGGGVITTSDIKIANKIRQEIESFAKPNYLFLLKKSLTTIFIYLITIRPIFGLFIYPFLRYFNYSLWRIIENCSVEEETTCLKTKRNVRFSNLQAEIGLYQLSRINYYVKRKINIIGCLDKKLSKIGSVIIQRSHNNAKAYKLYYVINIKDADKDQILRLRHQLLNQGIDTQFLDMYDCSTLIHFKRFANFCPNAAIISSATFEIPSDISLDLEDLNKIVSVVVQCTTNIPRTYPIINRRGRTPTFQSGQAEKLSSLPMKDYRIGSNKYD